MCAEIFTVALESNTCRDSLSRSAEQGDRFLLYGVHSARENVAVVHLREP